MITSRRPATFCCHERSLSLELLLEVPHDSGQELRSWTLVSCLHMTPCIIVGLCLKARVRGFRVMARRVRH